jgi:hypothetical protein
LLLFAFLSTLNSKPHLFHDYCGVVCIEVEPVDAPVPEAPYEPSIASGFSGCMLWISFSTGIAGGGAAGGFAPVTSAPGVAIEILELGGRNFSG